MPASAAAAALLLLSGCATGGGQVQDDVASLRAEVRTLQRENAALTGRVEAMATQIDVLSARAARVTAPDPVATRPAASPVANSAAASPAAAAVAEAAPVVPSNLRVVRLEPPRPAPAAKPVKGASSPPAVPTTTPIQDPTMAALAALAQGGSATPEDAQKMLDRARAQTGLTRARSLEQFADAYPSSVRAGEAIVDAARTRKELGDPDGSCEDYSRAVAEYPSARSIPDALEGLAACELRRGRPAEASRLLSRLAKDYPDSPAGKRARELAPPVQGAAP